MNYREIKKNNNDTNNYKYIKLDNDIEVLIIHNNKFNNSKCALSVNIGSTSDSGIDGLAHFVEHLLFMGTKKYPIVNEYMNFISLHGGSTNAFTGQTSTCYYFNIDNDHLINALDIFGHFFICPLFDEKYVKKEINAVNSEHIKNKTIDYWKKLECIKLLTNNVRFKTYDCGYEKTLNIPNIHIIAKNFFDNFYFGKMMKIIISSNKKFDEIEPVVNNIFGQIKNKNEKIIIKYDKIFDENNMLIKIIPNNDTCILSIFFDIKLSPDMYKYIQFTFFLLSNKRKKSLFNHLYDKNYILDFDINCVDIYENNAIFDFEFMLNDNGYDNYIDIINIFFEYLSFVKTSDFEKYYNEYKLAKEINDDYKITEQEIDIYSIVSNINNPLINIEDIIYTHNEEYNNNIKIIVIDIFDAFITSKRNFILMSKKNKNINKHNDILNFNYSIEKIQDFSHNIYNFKKIKLNQLTDKIAHIKINNIKYNLNIPELKYKNKNAEYWYCPKTIEKTPLSEIYIAINFNEIKNKKIRACLLLYIEHFKNNNKFFIDDICFYGGIIDISISDSFIIFHIKTINNIIYDVYENIIDLFLNTLKNEENFEKNKIKYLIKLKNHNFDQEFVQCINKIEESYDNTYISHKKIIEIIEPFNFNQMKKNIKKVFSGSFNIKCCLFGNQYFDIEKLNIFNESSNNEIVFPNNIINDIKNVSFFDDNGINNNAIVYGISMGFIVDNITPNWNTQLATMNILENIINEHFFKTLRTNEQIGYTVKTEILTIGRYDFPYKIFCFIVQSPIKNVHFLKKRIDNFLNELKSLIYKLTQKQLDILCESHINKLKDHIRLNVYDYYFTTILTYKQNFSTIETLIDTYKNIKINDIINVYETYYVNGFKFFSGKNKKHV